MKKSEKRLSNLWPMRGDIWIGNLKKADKDDSWRTEVEEEMEEEEFNL